MISSKVSLFHDISIHTYPCKSDRFSCLINPKFAKNRDHGDRKAEVNTCTYVQPVLVSQLKPETRQQYLRGELHFRSKLSSLLTTIFEVASGSCG